MIELKNIQKSYTIGNNKMMVLKGIDMKVNEGEMVSIMGSSGSGKSTLLNILGILDNYDAGEYRLGGTLIQHLNETKAAKLRNQYIGFVFQSFNLISFKNAMENVALPLYYQNISSKKRNAIALEYLDKVGLKDWANHMPNEMSGGQKQRVLLARALYAKPKILFLDEATSHLDAHNENVINEHIKQIGITRIIVAHRQETVNTAERVIDLATMIAENYDKDVAR